MHLRCHPCRGLVAEQVGNKKRKPINNPVACQRHGPHLTRQRHGPRLTRIAWRFMCPLQKLKNCNSDLNLHKIVHTFGWQYCNSNNLFLSSICSNHTYCYNLQVPDWSTSMLEVECHSFCYWKDGREKRCRQGWLEDVPWMGCVWLCV